MRMPLVNGQGELRLTRRINHACGHEVRRIARLAPLAMEMLRDIDKDTVNFRENYDGRSREPIPGAPLRIGAMSDGSLLTVAGVPGISGGDLLRHTPSNNLATNVGARRAIMCSRMEP